MPTYSARCTICGATEDYRASVENAGATPLHCGTWMKKVILKAPQGFVKGNFDRFRSPVDGSIISTERDLRNHNARNNVVNIHDGYDEATVMRGEYVKPTAGPDKKDIAKDIYESYQRVDSGYKPIIGVDEDA